ncbi:MAG: pseudouridylate synthase [Tannerellaceae bacterium]|jgi:predicted hotdog family 3-hydroxylacyl-ACP dehydratase|nr:pseudouridylate synthase [Tannerellaceae bacterium]
MQFSEIDITDLLPQRHPFVMIDKLLDFDKERVQTSLQVRKENIFCDEGCLSESGLIENIAQTCAARMGYINKYICDESVKLGFIGSIRNMEILRLPQIGEVLTTEILIVEEIFQMTLVHAAVSIGEERIASCEMKISITNIARKE